MAAVHFHHNTLRALHSPKRTKTDIFFSTFVPLLTTLVKPLCVAVKLEMIWILHETKDWT